MIKQLKTEIKNAVKIIKLLTWAVVYKQQELITAIYDLKNQDERSDFIEKYVRRYNEN